MEDSSISRRLINGNFHLPTNSPLDPLPCQEIPADLFPEILTWLPVKSLMRFKSVSRGWLSIITDPFFARAYRGGMRGLCACRPPEYYTLVPEMDFIRLNLDDGIATKLIVDHGGKKFGYTNLVNGLICFFSGNYSWLYNIATRETLQLPISVYESRTSSYHFGFDPVSKLHKLLKICPEAWRAGDPYGPYGLVFRRRRFLKCENLTMCEILTIGVDASWRTVDSLPPARIISECSCIDGALYWLAPPPDGGRIIAFDLSEEKFQPFIHIPPNFSGISLAKYGPRLALFTQILSPESDSPKSAISYYTNNAWSPSLEYPRQYPGYNQMCPIPYLVPQGILPNGKLVLYVDHRRFVLGLFYPIQKDDIEVMALNLFDPIEGQFQEIEVALDSRDIMKWDIIDGHSFYYYEETIMPLRCLNSCP